MIINNKIYEFEIRCLSREVQNMFCFADSPNVWYIISVVCPVVCVSFHTVTFSRTSATHFCTFFVEISFTSVAFALGSTGIA